MIDILIFFIGIPMAILAIVFAIPRLVVLSTESEGDPDHIYTIFWEESGHRGDKILSAAGCLFPFVLLSNPLNDVERTVLTIAISVACLVYHSSVYKGYSVLSRKMKIALAFVLCFIFTISMLTRLNILTGGTFIFLLVLSGTAWGGYAVYRRSVLIRITRGCI